MGPGTHARTLLSTVVQPGEAHGRLARAERPRARRGAHASARTRRYLLRVPLALWVALALVFGSGGAAYAFFSGGGTGTGHAKVGTTVEMTATATTGTADLFPGETGTLYVSISSTNTVATQLTTVQSLGTITSSSATTCPASNLIQNGTTPHAFTPPIAVGAKTGTTPGTGSGSIGALVKLKATAPTACQGVTFTVHIVLKGKTT